MLCAGVDIYAVLLAGGVLDLSGGSHILRLCAVCNATHAFVSVRCTPVCMKFILDSYCTSSDDGLA
jgi:hypothetical protein